MPKKSNKDITVNYFINACHKVAREKGWWDVERSDEN